MPISRLLQEIFTYFKVYTYIVFGVAGRVNKARQLRAVSSKARRPGCDPPGAQALRRHCSTAVGHERLLQVAGELTPCLPICYLGYCAIAS